MPSYATLLRDHLAALNLSYARRLKLAHVTSYGSGRTVVYSPAEDGASHGNFHPASYAAIAANPEWRKRLSKAHTHKKKLPQPNETSARAWCELDACTSSDALLMNIFCSPGLARHAAVASLLAVDPSVMPQFGFKPRVPRTSTTGDATEIDMRLGDLLVEAKLTESNFQRRDVAAVERYRDFESVFDRESLPRSKPKLQLIHDHDLGELLVTVPGQRYESYQMIRNILAAYALDCRLCVLIDARRSDLREQYHAVLRAVRDAELRTRCTLLTWQELAAAVPADLKVFLAEKYGIVSQP
jgi:hypothetical protein